MSEPAAGNAIENIQATINNNMDEFTSPAAVATTNTNFLDSNGIIAKVVFLILVVIIFIVLFYFILRLIAYFTTPSKNPMLINGQINGSKMVSIPQNPGTSDSKIILRSNNRPTGIEFTWSLWINYSDNQQATNTTFRPVFIKGDKNAPSGSQYCSINNGPGVYFNTSSSKDPNTLYILMDTVNESATNSSSASVITVPNLPISTYFHLAIRCQNTYIDIYINGTLVKRQNLMSVPKQNYYNVYACPCGGFPGSLSNLQYFDKSLTVVEINSIVQEGPNLKDITQNPFSPAMPNTISTAWYNSFLK